MYKLTLCDVKFNRDGAAVIRDLLVKTDFYTPSAGIEEQLKRLVHVVGAIADKSGINLLEIINKHDLEGEYEFVGNETEGGK